MEKMFFFLYFEVGRLIFSYLVPGAFVVVVVVAVAVVAGKKEKDESILVGGGVVENMIKIK